MMAIKKHYAFILLFGFSTFLSYSQIFQQSLSEKAIPLDSTVRFGVLDNGFTYYLKNNNNPKGEVVLKMLVKSGSFHTDEDQIEYAHLLEHVAVKDLEKFKDLDVILTVNGIHLTAFTRRLSTGYTLRIPNYNQEKLNLGLNVLEQWAEGIVIDSSRLDMHAGSILGEMRPNDTYASNLYDKKLKIILKNIEFPFKDSKESIESIKMLNINRLRNFYKDWYRPNLQAAIVVGPINLDSIENVFRNKFSRLSGPKIERDPSSAIKKFNYQLTGKNQYESIKDTLNTNWRLNIISKRPNHEFKIKSEKDFYIAVIQNLYELIITERNRNYLSQYNPKFSGNAVSYHGNGAASSQVSIGLMNIELGSEPSKIGIKIADAVEADKIIHSNFTLEELNEAKEKLISAWKDESLSSINLANQYENHFVYQNSAPSENRLKNLQKLLQELTLSELQNFSENRKNLLKDTDFIFINVPETFIPGEKKIERIISKVYKSNTPENHSPINKIDEIKEVIKVEEISELSLNEDVIGITTLKLKNNIKVLFKPTAPQYSQFKNRIEFLGFQPIRFDGDSINYELELLAHNYPTFTGTDHHNHFQIEEFKRNRNMKLNFGFDHANFLIEAQFYKKNLHDFFNLLYQYIQSPEDHDQAFQYWKKKRIQRKSPYANKGGSNFFKEGIETIWNPLYPNLDKISYDDINKKALMKAYKDHFSNFNEYTFIVTGDFKTKELVKEISLYLSEFPVSGRREGKKITEWSNRSENINDTLIYPGIGQSFSEIFLPIKIEPSIKNQVLLNLVNTAFYERLVKVLHEDCYAPGAGGQWIDLNDSLYAFHIRFNSELGNEHNMFLNSMNEIKKLKKDGIDNEWLEAHIKHASQLFKSRINSFGYFNFWPQFLKKSLEQGRNYEEYILQYTGILENFVTHEDANKAINNYLKTDNLQKFLVLPE
jgi:predicted Zn-dependent peptidase